MSVYTPSDHLDMMRDPRRVSAFRRALALIVRPGDHVVDLGAGAGIMTFWALEVGAGHVTAIEDSDNVRILVEAARRAGVRDRITVHQADSRDVTLPAPADVLVADIRGALPIYRDALAVLDDARRRHLRPGGQMVPLRDTLQLAAVTAPKADAQRQRWNVTAGPGDYAFMVPQSAHFVERIELDATSLLSAPVPVASFAYDAPPPERLGGALTVRATASGPCHGLGVWFEAELAPDVGLSSAPELGPSVYGQGFFPLHPALELTKGDTIALTWEAWPRRSEPLFRWSAVHKGVTRAHSTFHAALFGLDDLARRDPGRRPGLSERGRLRLRVLEGAARGESLGELADALLAGWPHRYADRAAALEHAVQLTAS